MGVSGTGKSTIAKHVAQQLQYNFLDADDFHSDEAKKMMSEGQPINDDIRKIWIDNMLSFFSVDDRTNKNVVLAYSGLKAEQRKRFQSLPQKVISIFLHGKKALIASRIEKRAEHFFSSTLLDNQFDVLELPVEDDMQDNHLLMIDIGQSIEDITQQSLTFIKTQANIHEK